MKKTLQLGFGRRPQVNSIFVLTISSSYVNIKLHTKNIVWLILEIGMKKTLQLGFGRQQQVN